MSDKKQQPLILDRVKALEELSNGLAGFVDNEVGGLKRAVGELFDAINAIITVQGKEFDTKVLAELNSIRRNRSAAQIAKAVEEGKLQAADVVGEESLVVGAEFNSQGESVGTGRAQIYYSQFSEEAKPQALGAGVGTVIEVAGGKFEIQEIYDVVKSAEATAAE